MNQGLSSDEIKTILELKVKANDEQVRTIRGIFEGEWKERQLRQKMKGTTTNSCPHGWALEAVAYCQECKK